MYKASGLSTTPQRLPFEDLKHLNKYLANSEDPDEMLHNAAFHQSLLFAKAKVIFREKINFFGNYNMYTMDHPVFIVSNLTENSIGLKRVRQKKTVSPPYI